MMALGFVILLLAAGIAAAALAMRDAVVDRPIPLETRPTPD